MTTIRVKENEPYEVALRRFKRTIEKLGLLTDLRAREFYEKDSKPIKVTLPDGKQVDAESWKTTPYQIACGISQGLADNTVVAKVNIADS